MTAWVWGGGCSEVVQWQGTSLSPQGAGGRGASSEGPLAPHENSPVLPRPHIPTPPRGSWADYSSKQTVRILHFYIISIPTVFQQQMQGKA